ncbi:MAG: hypothetical protein K2K02_01190, partial [Ruminococcus sp.]|nr:hypothetical protein [Ruminococcus sp.]
MKKTMRNKIYRKLLKIIFFLILILSSIGMVCSVSSAVQKRNWKKTDALITGIGLPDKAVFGNYTDYTGKLH